MPYTQGNKKGGSVPWQRAASRLRLHPDKQKDESMATVTETLPPDKPVLVSYARLYGALEGYLVRTSAHALYFVDHDAHVYDLTTQPVQILTDLGDVPAIERANVLQALAR